MLFAKKPPGPPRIISHSIRDTWAINLDGKKYWVERDRKEGSDQEGWRVEVGIPGGYDGEIIQLRYCDDEGRVHKRVVTWMKEQLGDN